MFINIVSLLFFLNAVATQAQEDSVPCVDWEANAEAYEEAYAQWTAPSCYTFRYNYVINKFISGASTIRTVINGQPVESSPYSEIDTLDKFWNMIQRDCIQGCPTSGAHKCNIAYAMSEDGRFMYPSLVNIDNTTSLSMETNNFLIFDVTTIPCSEDDETEIVDIVHEPCVNWESTAAAYEEAMERWNPPSCYTFTYTTMGVLPEPPRTQTVIREQVNPSDLVSNMDYFWSMIHRWCMENCPSQGAHSCNIEYASSEDGDFMYPHYVSIDRYSTSIHSRLEYQIDDVRAIPCRADEVQVERPETEEQEYREEAEKSDSKKTKKNKKDKKENNKSLRKKGKGQKK